MTNQEVDVCHSPHDALVCNFLSMKSVIVVKFLGNSSNSSSNTKLNNLQRRMSYPLTAPVKPETDVCGFMARHTNNAPQRHSGNGICRTPCYGGEWNCSNYLHLWNKFRNTENAMDPHVNIGEGLHDHSISIQTTNTRELKTWTQELPAPHLTAGTFSTFPLGSGNHHSGASFIALPASPWTWPDLLRRRGAESMMAAAPTGAVTRMLSTAIVSTCTTSPCKMHLWTACYLKTSYTRDNYYLYHLMNLNWRLRYKWKELTCYLHQ